MFFKSRCSRFTTREIGVRKAIGATNFSILGQFLIESVIIASLGGLLG
jgi:putative ABC transport system permease protein